MSMLAYLRSRNELSFSVISRVKWFKLWIVSVGTSPAIEVAVRRLIRSDCTGAAQDSLKAGLKRGPSVAKEVKP